MAVGGVGRYPRWPGDSTSSRTSLPPSSPSWAAASIGYILMYRDQFAEEHQGRARAALDEALTLSRGLGDKRALAVVLGNFGELGNRWRR
jgi:hypothetical protein